MLTQAENVVKIEGLLSEIDLNYSNYTKDGKKIDSITGAIKIRVTQEINKKKCTCEIPVHIFANKYTLSGALNPAYESAEKIMKEYISIAATDENQADAVRITSGKIMMNEYYRNGRLISFPRISASFVTRIKRTEMKQTATFSINFVVGSKNYEVDKEGKETGRYCVQGIIPQYGGRVDVVPFFVVNEAAIESISSYWEAYDTVSAVGKLNFSSTTEDYTVEVDFGEPETRTRTVSISDLIITGGTQQPLEGERAYTKEEIDEALAQRKCTLDASKEKDKGSFGGAASKPKSKPNLGF